MAGSEAKRAAVTPADRGARGPRPLGVAGLAIAGWLVAAAVPARAQIDDYRPPLPIWVTLQTGLMFPAGDEGSELRRGAEVVGSLGYQLSPGFVIEGDLGLFSSTDVARTRVVMLGVHGRLNPHTALRELYVIGGAGLYDVTYHPELAGITPPPDKIRPGMSFGIGWDFAQRSRFTFGALGSYHGIVMARSDALAYVTLGIYASFRPSML